MQISFVNGSRVQFTLHELLGFHRQRHAATAMVLLWLALVFLKPFPALAALPLANQVVFWGLVFPGTFAIYLLVLIALGRKFTLARSWIAHVVSAIACGLLSPELGILIGLERSDPMLEIQLIVMAFSLICSMLGELLMVTYLMPRFLARLEPKAAPIDTPEAALPVTPPATDEKVVSLLGRPVALNDLRLVSAEEHYVHIQTVQGRQMLRGRISDIEAQLPDALGLRVHRSHWVAATAVSSLNRAREGWTLELTDGTVIPVARARRTAVKDWVEAMGKG
ncbi:LytTR family DNA-binding domain-containing protein [Gemmobacter nectariphilus]|uniref:LytTR family DNA-binding domain-containing protein n=1 Tax=Gemmobacter nectariphilus TaxID=220343 RepID=UPI000484AE46|nr:LytTR family DNA-binding domain-containing protein [Gemmobacter nectariphilus]